MGRTVEAPALTLRHRARVWLTIRLGRLNEWVGRSDYRRRPDWLDGCGGPLNGQEFRQRLVAELLMHVPLVAIVETGTLRGTTTEYFRNHSDLPIHSFEANPRHYGFARARLRSVPDIQLSRCDSRVGLKRLATSRVLAAGPVFFYLDAHGFGALPLADEVGLVFGNWPQAVIMIDDFAVADDPGYGFDSHNGQTLEIDYLAARGALPSGVWFPACPAHAETGARRGCVVLANDGQVIQRLDALRTLRRWPALVCNLSAPRN